MPDVIDNNKVGLLIKKLIKDHNMTQDDLAKELCISKSAVSQNLNGKSTFDIQNLISISKLFDISLEQLLIQKSDGNNKELVSEYERLVKKGISAFSNIAVENMQISNPDIYGNVLIEYVIAYGDVELFKLFHSNYVKLLDDTYHKARLIYMKLIWFSLKHQIEDVRRYIEVYASLFGSLSFSDEFYSEEIWKQLNEEKYQGLVKQLIEEKFFKKVKGWFGYEVTKAIAFLSKREWVENIAKYRLENVLRTINKNLSFSNDYGLIVRTFLNYKYFDGIVWYIDNLKRAIKAQELNVAGAQEILLEMADANDLTSFEKALNKGLYTNINKLVSYLIVEGNHDYYMLCINNYERVLDFHIVGEAAVTSRNLDLLKVVIKKFKQNDLDYFLSIAEENNQEMLLYLIEQGAKFEIGYYNSSTMNKINNTIETLLRGRK